MHQVLKKFSLIADLRHIYFTYVAPDTVQFLRGTVLSPQAVNISWQPPLGGESYLDYQVTLTPLYRNSASRQSTTSSTSIVMTGLQPGAFYICVVAARTRGGLQHSVNIVLIELPPDGNLKLLFHNNSKCVYGVQFISAPSGFPRSITHVPFNTRTLRLFWSPPPLQEQNGVIVKYGIRITEIETGEQRQYLTRDSTSAFVIPNLHPHYHYTYTVTAFTSAGSGPDAPFIHVQMPQDGMYSISFKAIL